ncbi:MAG TPA: hypothetical protein VGQ53_13610 [Chitinophagaceae bacterium]|jgi:hypothetical protein|nr:hypothetical protein [Chitinophagaceae bacterium]
MRDLTAIGFFTSKMGIEDLGYKAIRQINGKVCRQKFSNSMVWKMLR